MSSLECSIQCSGVSVKTTVQCSVDAPSLGSPGGKTNHGTSMTDRSRARVHKKKDPPPSENGTTQPFTPEYSLDLYSVQQHTMGRHKRYGQTERAPKCPKSRPRNKASFRLKGYTLDLLHQPHHTMGKDFGIKQKVTMSKYKITVQACHTNKRSVFCTGIIWYIRSGETKP